MNADALPWPPASICIRPSSLDVQLIAADIYARTCRTDFSAPGFCVVNLGSSMDSVAFRQLMVDLKRAMAVVHESQTENTLIYVSAARFDQQETTRPHLDGGPDECFLMLGYEPSEVDAELEIADYAKCAFDLGLSPKEFMAKHNPVFPSGHDLLRSYSTRIPCFSRSDYQIICVNDSSAPFSQDQPTWQGTLHTATILTPDETKRRVINSTMIALAPAGTPDTITGVQQQEFITTSIVHCRGYDKSHLKDDL
ncbi:hypothetical protein [Roseimaritima ulvae]|uniref:Uncharacterized protein n=1 Tax=Roseimaritima ulvae TaxID=980254 RepID=A0A5B9QWM4_9BACT|nr:hypothetical protein [Roseimaritima ulvae]QEG43417.1 hypothetical protein UC8_54660 [Roseimaritima ulvae]